MHFHRITRKRAEVPIVPMIDILFILLVFFIVSTTFKKPRDILRIELPTVREVPSDTVTEPPGGRIFPPFTRPQP